MRCIINFWDNCLTELVYPIEKIYDLCGVSTWLILIFKENDLIGFRLVAIMRLSSFNWQNDTNGSDFFLILSCFDGFLWYHQEIWSSTTYPNLYGGLWDLGFNFEIVT